MASRRRRRSAPASTRPSRPSPIPTSPTLIAGLVLWVFGRGAIRGFAVVLMLGIATSMFTSLMGSRALITLMYGGRRKVDRLSIG